MLERYKNELLQNTYLGATFSARYLRRSRLFRTDDLAPAGLDAYAQGSEHPSGPRHFRAH
jgi:hypothetical protein